MADIDELSIERPDEEFAFGSDADDTFGAMTLTLRIEDPEILAALTNYRDPADRQEFAMAALRIGVLALRQATGQLDAGLVQRECERMLRTLDKQLAEHAMQLNHRLAGSLQEYFDPTTGRFQERVNRLISRDGELEQVLRRQLGAEDSVLCKTLTSHVGATSPLMKVLSPTESQGLLSTLSTTLVRQLNEQREAVLKEFSLNDEQSALSRFGRQLADNQGALSRNLQDRIAQMAKEFSLDDDASALSRFKRTIEKAEQAIRGNLTLDDENSSLARLKREVVTLLDAQFKSSQEFQEEVKVTLASMNTRRVEAARSTQHGNDFEAAAFEYLDRLAQQAGDIAEATGGTTGLIKNCKIGDCVLTLGPDTAAPGARIVIEAKEKQKYDLRAAIEEIDQARKNRDAQVGVFLFSKKAAPSGLEPLARYGNDVIAIWDAEDTQSDIFFRSALTLAKALCLRTHHQKAAQSADFSELDAAVLEINKRSDELDKINGWSETIRKNSDNIIDHVRKTRQALARQVKVLDDNLAELKQTLSQAEPC